MARGGRSSGGRSFGSHGRSFGSHRGYGSHSYGSHHRYHGRGGGSANCKYQIDWTAIAASISMPKILNGKYTHQGNQISVTTQLQNFEATVAQFQSAATTSGLVFPPVVQMDLTIIGNRISQGSNCCYVSTMMCMFTIVPAFFMCCDWWKKIVYSAYTIQTQTYTVLNDFLINHPSIKVVNLHIVDNSFGSQKSSLVYQMVQSTNLTGFNLINNANPIGLNENQHDNFLQNMAPIKSLPTTSILVWGDAILM